MKLGRSSLLAAALSLSGCAYATVDATPPVPAGAFESKPACDPHGWRGAAYVDMALTLITAATVTGLLIRVGRDQSNAERLTLIGVGYGGSLVFAASAKHAYDEGEACESQHRQHRIAVEAASEAPDGAGETGQRDRQVHCESLRIQMNSAASEESRKRLLEAYKSRCL